MNALRYVGLLFGVTSLLALSGCGSSSNPVEESGTLELAVTDAEEDFLSYKIDLDSVTLIRKDGSRVDILPVSTEIDFVQYQELSELFAVMSVPAGIYQSMVLGLDYTDANIVIQDEQGESYTASVVDSNGQAIQQMNVELSLDNDKPLVITPRKTAQLTLDLDLAASNTIESFNPPLVSVEPFMLAEAKLDLEREHRVRGLMSAVDSSQQTVTLKVRPMRLQEGEFGQFTFAVNNDTRYEINGVEYSAENGLSALASLSLSTPVVAYGVNLQDDDLPYIAHQVIAGSSVPWNNQDVLKGTITARSGNTLTLQGAVIESAGQSAHFRQTIHVSLSENSQVTGYRLGDADINQLSVGQEIIALGHYDATTTGFDATEGAVRMKINRIVGEVVQQSPLVVDLSHINRRPVDVFDFTGTGHTALDDADPDYYEIATRDLDLTAIETSEWLQVRGYPSAFGSSPADFDALSILNPEFSSHLTRLMIHWEENAEASITVENDTLQLVTTDARTKLHLRGIPGSTNLNMQVASISAAEANGVYAVYTKASGIHVFRDFSEFAVELNRLMTQGLNPVHLTAGGLYSDTSHNLSARKVTVFLSASLAASNTLEVSE